MPIAASSLQLAGTWTPDTFIQDTNGLESILALVEQRVGKVDRWTTRDQKQRWLAAVLLEIEPRLRRLRGYRVLPHLRVALTQGITQGKEVLVA